MENESRPPTWLETSGKATARLIPYIGSAVSTILEDVLERHRARGLAVIADIATQVPDPNQIMGRLAENEEVELIFIEGVEVAVRSGFADKRRLLAKVVARAINDDSTIEESQLIIAALRELDGPHIRTLARLREAQRDEARKPDPPGATEEKHLRVRRAIMEAARDAPAPILSALVRTGVAYPVTILGAGLEIGALTDFGELLLQDLDSASLWM